MHRIHPSPQQQKFESKYFSTSISIDPTIVQRFSPTSFLPSFFANHSIVHRSSPHFAFVRLFIHRPPLTHGTKPSQKEKSEKKGKRNGEIREGRGMEGPKKKKHRDQDG